jgi:hypothetical protein
MAAADQVLTAGLSIVSVLVGYGAKMGQDWWTAKRARQQADEALWSLHRQQLHLPLLGAARELGARLSELAAVYGGTSPGSFTPESLSRDFRELYLLRPDELPDRDGALLSADGNEPRRNDRAVQGLRKRMCYELNFATSSLYRTARYLAQARLVHQHLSGGGSILAAADGEGLDRLIAEVGAGLQGATGAGIFLEQQESIAEMMVDADGRVLSHFDFRRRLLEVPGWEQFTALFLFFITERDQPDGPHGRARFAAKLPHEVQATTAALARLEARLAEVCGWSSGRGP